MKNRFLKFLGPLAVVGFVFAAAALNAYAEEGYSIISTEELAKRMNTEPKPLLIYSLSHIEFLEARIPGSTCIPAETMDVSAKMPANRNAPLIFYCHGPG